MAGDDRAARFRELVLPQFAYLHRLARALARDRQAAEDLAQETILRGLRYFDGYRGDDFRAWIAAIMRNLSRDPPPSGKLAIVRDATAETIARIADPALDPEQHLLVTDRDDRLRALLDALPEALREILILREYGELSYAQIAAALALPIGTVMSRLSRAREDLRMAWLAEGTRR